jgi:hypothetical protein
LSKASGPLCVNQKIPDFVSDILVEPVGVFDQLPGFAEQFPFLFFSGWS